MNGLNDIENIWPTFQFEYGRLHNKLIFISKKNKNQYDKKIVENKILRLHSCMSNVIDTMEDISRVIDEIYENKGIIKCCDIDESDIDVKIKKNNVKKLNCARFN